MPQARDAFEEVKKAYQVGKVGLEPYFCFVPFSLTAVANVDGCQQMSYTLRPAFTFVIFGSTFPSTVFLFPPGMNPKDFDG